MDSAAEQAKQGESRQRPPPKASRDLLGTFALLACVACWASVPVMLRSLTDAVDGWTANGVRYPLAAILYWPVLIGAYRSGLLDRSVVGRCAVPAVLALGGQVLWGLAPYYMAAGAMGFFLRSSLVWSLAGAMILFHDERGLLRLRGFYLGLVLTIIGFAALSFSPGMLGGGSGAGVVIMIFCSMFFGLYGVSVRHFVRGIHPIVGFGVVSQIVSLGTFVAMWLFGEPSRLAEVAAADGFMLVFSSIVGVALGHFFLYTAVQRLGAAIPACVGSLAPFLTVALASVLLNEAMTIGQLLAGMAMVAGALVLLATQHAVVRSMRAGTV